jgi:hypothetical protein
MRAAGNDYNVQEAAGAFGDLGTLIPFLVGYVTITRLDPQNLLLAFGITAMISGLYFRTPLPVQPMKAIGTAAITHAGLITPGAVWIAAAATGVAWLRLGVSGVVTWIAALTSRPVVRGIVLGLGLSFILEGATLMRSGPVPCDRRRRSHFLAAGARAAPCAARLACLWCRCGIPPRSRARRRRASLGAVAPD